MRASLLMASILAISAAVVSPALADEQVVIEFVGEHVTAYAAADASDGEPIPACAFTLPATILDSAMMRILIEGPAGQVWIRSAEAVKGELAGVELPDAPTISSAAPRVGATRTAEEEASEGAILEAATSEPCAYVAPGTAE